MMNNKENRGKVCVRIERKHLLIKMHYFLLYGGVFIIQPYFFRYALQLGLGYDAVFLLYIILQFSYLFSKPMIGAISDHFKIMKTIIMVLITLSAMLWWMILLIPPLVRDTDSRIIPMKCDENTLHIVPSISYSYNASCYASLVQSNATCNFRVEQCDDVRGMNVDYCLNVCHETTLKEYVSDSLYEIFNHSLVELAINNSLLCDCVGTILHLISCNHPADTCFFKRRAENANGSETMKFWSFAVLLFTSGTAIANALSLTDAACCKILEEKSQLYGRQRVWGTINIILCTLLSNYLFHIPSTEIMNYTPRLCIMSVLFFLDLIVIYYLDTRYTHIPDKVYKHVAYAFISVRNASFAIGCILIGGLAGLLWYSRFLHIEDPNASPPLLAVSMVITELAGEVFCFLISGKLIRKFGHFYCLIIAFAVYTLRYALYCFLKMSWYVLPIEILHGFTYGIFYATMVSFAYEKASSRTEATTFGVLGGMYDGLGMSIGGILSKLSVSHLGGHDTFLIATIISGVFVFTFFFANLLSKTSHARTARRHNRW